MASGNNAAELKQGSDVTGRNALITKIALFLNYLSKSDHEKLLRDMKKYEDPSRIDILKIMLSKSYISQQDVALLKKTCLSFAKAQKDSRFGSLCIDFGFLTQSNLDLALEEQARLAQNDQTIRLGNLLVDAGMLSERQRNLVLQKQKLSGVAPQKGTAKQSQQSGPPEFDKSNMRELRESEIIILIQNDALKAYIVKTDDFDNEMLLVDLKFLLEKNGIIYGVVDDDSLNNFIKDDKYSQTPFQIAKGLESIDGTDAQIIYMFEQDFLKAGNLAKDGSMDFKDRGDIPFVKQGDILAEKIPPKDGKDGINIYGDTVPKNEPIDISFNLGRGVCLSEDGLKARAEVDGNPKLKPGEELSVNDSLFIEGDVDYTTGHIKFDKNVFIAGSIKSGFRVEAIDVVASTIDGGIVKAEGDVFVQNGVTESSIEAKGNISAGFMHRSEAACMGDMNIVKEIADTKAVLEGTFEIAAGRMVSSYVCAKGGAKVYNIGSEKAKPSTIVVGTSMYLEKELKNIDKEIEKHQNLLENRTVDKNKTETRLNEITEKLTNYEKSKQRTLAMISQMQDKNPNGADNQADLFQKSLDEAEKIIHELNDQKALLTTQLTGINHTLKRCSEAVKVSVKEKFTLKRLNQKNPPKPIVDVAGKVLNGTRINGRHAKLILSSTLSRSRIMEMNTDEGEGKNGWEMVITNM